MHVKFIADFRTMVMACSGRQFGLCRQFTYRTIIPPTLDLQMMVETDASDHVIAGILLVTTKDNEIQPVAFFSHSLQGVEKNYDTHDKELLAIFKAFKNW